MTPDLTLVSILALAFAAIFLWLIMVLSEGNPEVVVAKVASMTPAAKRQARFDALDEMTRIADQAIQARSNGRLFSREDAGM